MPNFKSVAPASSSINSEQTKKKIIEFQYIRLGASIDTAEHFAQDTNSDRRAKAQNIFC